MEDQEIESLLTRARYRYDLATGRYSLDESDEEDDFATEDIAEELNIPLSDLLTWEDRQQRRDEAVGD
ncbi:MAG TPA: hypothetical protein VMD30_10205 [Tepidisphaeraceae bacterium]|nr:hypothetical protein [Tepidisphaeraceae bacterium]